ncbi:hypothetical protein ACQPYK_20970 [Streptosporangium sp. CA-135522]|uniref:hypothetical protein n=1 Tax=Streptosporangium sp. CA-135522 TaxID=3240072 RepID=UPI003D8FFE85
MGSRTSGPTGRPWEEDTAVPVFSCAKGDDGAGGRFAFGDDEFGVGFGYVADRMIGHGDARADRLVAAARECPTGG